MMLEQKLRYWKEQIVDLGKRNRLINCPMPNNEKRFTRTSILIQKPDFDELWKIFAEDEKEIEFPVAFEDESNGINNTDVANYKKVYTFSNGIKTNQPINEAQKTLRSLMKKSKEFSENKGLNPLYLAFGFLNWKDGGITGEEMRSPLLLVPVTLRQSNITEPIILSRADDEVIYNKALQLKLFKEFGITLPSYEDGDNMKDYINNFKKSIASIKWTVTTDVIQLSVFSYLKMAMYQDMEKNSDKILNNPIIQALNGNGSNFTDFDISSIENYDHDSENPQETFSVLDADSSQQDAILLAKKGVSFVLQGPPGTGKSQTITNIIAELLADNKKVLFVSEKMAALEVVYRT